MYYFVIISLALAQSYGAPIDLATEPSDTVSVYEDKVTGPLQPIHYETSEAYPTTVNYVLKEEPTATVLYPVKEGYEDTTPLAPSIDVVEEIPKGLIVDTDKILDAGKHLSEAITAKIVGPVVIFNSKVAAAAGALPPMLAAKGAIIGSAIATPIEIGAVAGSSIVSGITGKLVAVPISVATGTIANCSCAVGT